MERHLHSISLLLLMVAVTVSLLEVLSLATALYDRRLSLRQAELITSGQALCNEANRALASGSAETDSETVFSDGNGHLLRVRLSERDGRKVIAEWKSVTEWTENRRIGNLIRTGETEETQ